MADETNIIDNHSLILPKASSGAIMGKQSVRATFRLTENCTNAINIVATHLGIKKKSLLDHLMEDTEAIKSIAEASRGQEMTSKPVISKTFVISRNSLEVLNKMSKAYGIPKESLIELSVQRLLPIIAKEQLDHNERKKFLDEITKHLNQGKTIHKKIKKNFSSNDIIYQKFDQIMTNYQQGIDDIQKYIDKSKNIEKFIPDPFKLKNADDDVYLG